MTDFRDEIFPGQLGPTRLQRIVLEFESFRDFIQLFSPRVSEDGMFVESDFLPDAPPAVGEQVDFEVRLKDDFRLVHGRGEVTWAQPDTTADGTGGLAITFQDLDDPSRRLVTRLISNYIRDGGEPFELPEPQTQSLDAVEPEVLARSEADELFAPEISDEATQQQELHSVAPAADGGMSTESSLDPIASEVAGALPEQNELESVVAGVDDIFSQTQEPVITVPEAPKSLLEPQPDSVPPALDDVLSPPEEPPRIEPLPIDSTLPSPKSGPVVLDVEKVLEAERELDHSGSHDAGKELEPLVEPVLGGGPEDSLAPADDSSVTTPFGADESPPGVEGPAVEPDEPEVSEAPSASVIPDEIAQIAEQLAEPSGQRPVEMPSEEDQVVIAGAAQAKESHSPWRALVIASLAGAALGVAAWFFAGDQLKSWIGLDGGGPEVVATAEEPAAEPVQGAVEDDGEAEASQVAVESGAGAVAVTGSEGGESSEERAEPTNAGVEESASPAVGAASDSDEELAAATGPASRIEGISWSEEGDATVLTIQLNGRVDENSFDVVRIPEGTPREVIKIFGIVDLYRPKQIDVGTGQVARLRLGLHGSETESEIHIVADLTAGTITAKQIRAEGNRLLVTFS